MDQKTQKKSLWLLFLIMVKIGLVTFGGGWSIVAQMEQEFCNKRRWLTKEELLDCVSLGRSMPGIMIMNIGTMFGYSVFGLPGVLVTNFGLALPSFVVMIVVTFGYRAIRGNALVQRALVGVRAAVVPIVIVSIIKLRAGAMVDKVAWALGIGAFLLCTFTPVNNLIVVVLGALAGLLLGNRRQGGNTA